MEHWVCCIHNLGTHVKIKFKKQKKWMYFYSCRKDLQSISLNYELSVRSLPRLYLGTESLPFCWELLDSRERRILFLCFS